MFPTLQAEYLEDKGMEEDGAQLPEPDPGAMFETAMLLSQQQQQQQQQNSSQGQTSLQPTMSSVEKSLSLNTTDYWAPTVANAPSPSAGSQPPNQQSLSRWAPTLPHLSQF